MGTNKRYADQIDTRVAARTEEIAARPPVKRPPVRDWTPPWPPIRIGESEWIIMRDAKDRPAAVIRTVKLGPRNETFFRVVTWAPTSEGRELVGYFDTLAMADRSVHFAPANPRMPEHKTAGTN